MCPYPVKRIKLLKYSPIKIKNILHTLKLTYCLLSLVEGSGLRKAGLGGTAGRKGLTGCDEQVGER